LIEFIEFQRSRRRVVCQSPDGALPTRPGAWKGGFVTETAIGTVPRGQNKGEDRTMRNGLFG
jgi:hypothetical protein